MSKRNWFNELQAAASQYPHLAWAIDRMSAEYSSAQQWKPVAASLSSGCAEQQDRIEELEAKLVDHRPPSSKLLELAAASIVTLTEQLDAVRNGPVSIKINADGQAWIKFNAGGGREALVNLNNLVSDMPRVGINRGICMDALSAALQGDKDV